MAADFDVADADSDGKTQAETISKKAQTAAAKRDSAMVKRMVGSTGEKAPF